MIEAKINAQNNFSETDFRLSNGIITSIEKEIDMLVCGMYGVEVSEVER